MADVLTAIKSRLKISYKTLQAKDPALRLSNTALSNEDVAFLVESLTLNEASPFREINLVGNGLDPSGIQILCDYLSRNPKITSLVLGRNPVDSLGAKYLAQVLQFNMLTELYLNNSQIGADGAKFIAESLKSNYSLTELCLRENSIGKEGSQVLLEAIQSNRSLKSLTLSGNKGIDEKALADVLRRNSSLTFLGLSSCGIGNTGAKSISDGISENSSLKELWLQTNLIEDEGIICLSESLRKNSSLTTLVLRGNPHGEPGWKSVLELVQQNTFIVQGGTAFEMIPILSRTQIYGEFFIEIQAHIDANQAIQKVFSGGLNVANFDPSFIPAFEEIMLCCSEFPMEVMVQIVMKMLTKERKAMVAVKLAQELKEN